MAAGRFGQLLRDAELVGAPTHLGPHLVGADAAFVPQHDQATNARCIADVDDKV